MTPHKAFTYRMHDYESVVGPVKGVYTKDNSNNKAREHALLVSNRPSFVTILTLGNVNNKSPYIRYCHQILSFVALTFTKVIKKAFQRCVQYL